MKESIARLIRLSIGKKLLLGFLSYGVLTILIALFTLSSLNQLTDINTGITRRDIPLTEIADRMAESLLAQELYASRAMILKSSDVLSLFEKRSEEFKQLIEQMSTLPQRETIRLLRRQIKLRRVNESHGGYSAEFWVP
ncbi:MAG: hypothetical protein ABSF48_29475 [Thermodesulfobacteriota bacterium]